MASPADLMHMLPFVAVQLVASHEQQLPNRGRATVASDGQQLVNGGNGED
jgi:hypothetical protein